MHTHGCRSRVADPESFFSDPDPYPDPTFKDVSAPNSDPAPDPDPVSDPSRERESKLTLYSRNYDDIYIV